MSAISIDSPRFKARFWSRVQPAADDQCWPWMRGCQTKGYGQIYLGEKAERAHRIAFYLAKGYWPKVACHTCDNPICCNPKHIVDGTYKLNMQHRTERNRHNARKGECVHGARFNETQVLEIRKRASAGISQCQIARDFGCVQSLIHYIVSCKTWTHI